MVRHTIYTTRAERRAQSSRIAPAPTAPAGGQKTKGYIEGEDLAAASIRRGSSPLLHPLTLLEQKEVKKKDSGRVSARRTVVPYRSHTRIYIYIYIYIYIPTFPGTTWIGSKIGWVRSMDQARWPEPHGGAQVEERKSANFFWCVFWPVPGRASKFC